MRRQKTQPPKTQPTKPGKPASRRAAKPRLLAGGNPQIAKADGDAAVQAYLAAMPGWTRAVGRRLDDLVTRAVPGVAKAVRWNSPFYGVPGKGWFLSFHCFTRYVKVAFFRGAALRPPPPVASKDEHARYLHVPEEGALDEARFEDWVRQASRLPGWGADAGDGAPRVGEGTGSARKAKAAPKKPSRR